MSTRDHTRQELRDLAKLAATMPRELPTPPPPPALQRPPTPSSVSKLTVPPAVVSIPPASMTLAPPRAGKRGGRTGALVVSVALGLSVAVAGGVTLGRTLAHRAPPIAAAASDARVVTFGAPAHSPSPAPSPAPAPAPSPALALSPPPATAVATKAPVATSAPLLKAAVGPSPRHFAAKATPKSALTVHIPASTGAKDPLEEAIRKAVASAPPTPPASP